MTEPVTVTIAGQPAPEETAAVLAVLAALAAGPAAGGGQAGKDTRSSWSDRSRMMPPAVTPGPGAWRASALPG